MCGKQMGAKVTLTRILNHYRFDDLVKRPDVSKCTYSRDQLLKDFPDSIALRDEHFAKKKVQHPAAGQPAPATAVRSGWWQQQPRLLPLPWVGFPCLGP